MAQDSHPALHLNSAVDGRVLMILLIDRRIEDTHHGVPDKLVHHPARFLDAISLDSQRPVHDLNHLRWLQSLGEAGEAPDVGE